MRILSGKQESEITIIYDGECPVCSAYVTHMRLRDIFTSIKLINAREALDLVDDLKARGKNIDDGMLVIVDETEFYGAEAVNALALLSTGSGWYNAINAKVFSNATLCRFLYPIMRTSRGILLKILGKKKIYQ